MTQSNSRLINGSSSSSFTSSHALAVEMEANQYDFDEGMDLVWGGGMLGEEEMGIMGGLVGLEGMG